MRIKDEQSRLKQQDSYSKFEASLQLFKNKDGVRRLRGRFANTSLPYREQYPIILRKQSHFTRLVILMRTTRSCTMASKQLWQG